jgi:hypothetical protein
MDDIIPKKVLLHACCAPCSAAIIEWMQHEGIELTLFFYNPNIYPQQEYEIRKNELKRFAEAQHIPYIEGDYDHAKWREAVRGFESEPERGARCLECFKTRLAASALCAKELGFAHYTTTLAGSRWKRQDQIEAAARFAEEKVPGVTYWNRNWRKGGLQERRGVLLKQYGFYNQQYCGCEFSMARLQKPAAPTGGCSQDGS